MLNKKTIGKAVASLLIFSQFSIPAFAGTWEKLAHADQWRYQKDNGSYATNEWLYENGSWYYLGNYGTMANGPRWGDSGAIGGQTYYFDKSGKLSTGGFVNYDTGTRYFTDKDGHIVNGLFMVDGVLYLAFYSNYLINTSHTYDTSLIVYDKSTNLATGRINYKNDHGKVLDTNGQPFSTNSELYSKIDYLPQYDSKGNLIGAIKGGNYIIRQ